MEPNGFARHPGATATDEQRGGYSSSRERVRPFTVQEALAHSPMSSVVPFNTGTCPHVLLNIQQPRPIYIILSPTAYILSLGIIPLPGIGVRASPSIFSTPIEKNAAREGLAILDEPTSESNGTTQRLGKALSDLQELLKPEKISK